MLADPLGAEGASFALAAYRETVVSLLRMMRDSIVDEHESLRFFIAGFDFSLLRSDDRRYLVFNASDLPSVIAYSAVTEDSGPDPLAAQAASANAGPSGRNDPLAPIYGPAADPVPEQATGDSRLRDRARYVAVALFETVFEVLGNPLAIFIVALAASAWLLATSVRWIGERRRRRQLRRRSRRPA